MPNRAHGKGVFRKKNGNTYEGEYKYDKCEGFGVYRFNNGDKYEGTWKNGLKNGQGTISWSNGCKFEGRFADDFPIIGELTEADGKVYSVTYDGTQKFSNGAQPESQKLIRTDPPRPSEMKAAPAKLRQETSPGAATSTPPTGRELPLPAAAQDPFGPGPAAANNPGFKTFASPAGDQALNPELLHAVVDAALVLVDVGPRLAGRAHRGHVALGRLRDAVKSDEHGACKQAFAATSNQSFKPFATPPGAAATVAQTARPALIEPMIEMTAGAAARSEAVVWEFQEGKVWKVFDSAAAIAAEAALQASEPVAQSLFKNARTGKETRYTYDLARMLQTDTTTSFERKIRRTPPPPAPTWQFEEHEKWLSFDRSAASAAEAALQASPPVRVVRIFYLALEHTKTKKSTAYEFDLMERLQTNTETRNKRKIRRIPPYDVSVFPDDAPPAENKSACSLCCEDGRISKQDAAEKISDNCGHERSVCNECLARHVEAEVRSKGNFTTIKCPQSGCGAEMEHHKVQQWAIASVFETYDQLKLRDYLQKNDEFRWCSHNTCGSGQLHHGASQVMRCFKCRRKTCFTHRCRWHKNRTCSQYDQDAAACEEVALLQALQKGAGIKQCPQCRQGIQKNDGCDHMTCKKPAGCGFQFCWRCEAPYDGSSGIRKMGNKAHKPSCLYHM